MPVLSNKVSDNESISNPITQPTFVYNLSPVIFMQNKRNLILARRIFILLFLAILILQTSNFYFIKITSQLLSEILLFSFGFSFAVFGGAAYYIGQKKMLKLYLKGISSLFLLTLLSLFIYKNLLANIGMGFWAFGFMFLTFAISPDPE